MEQPLRFKELFLSQCRTKQMPWDHGKGIISLIEVLSRKTLIWTVEFASSSKLLLSKKAPEYMLLITDTCLKGQVDSHSFLCP